MIMDFTMKYIWILVSIRALQFQKTIVVKKDYAYRNIQFRVQRIFQFSAIKIQSRIVFSMLCLQQMNSYTNVLIFNKKYVLLPCVFQKRMFNIQCFVY